MNPVQLVSGTAGMHPTGTGSFAYGSSFLILVDNLAFEKVVGIWGRDAGTFNWSFDPGHFEQSVPGNGGVLAGEHAKEDRPVRCPIRRQRRVVV